MIEIERKYLLKNNELPKKIQPYEHQFIKQGYCFIRDNKHLRVRIVDNSTAFLCYKSNIELGSKYEVECKINLKDAFQIYSECEYTLTKNRLLYPKRGFPIDIYTELRKDPRLISAKEKEVSRKLYPQHQLMIDVYEDGDIVAEVEFTNTDELDMSKLKIEYLNMYNLEKDVTSESKYSNITKAINRNKLT